MYPYPVFHRFARNYRRRAYAVAAPLIAAALVLVAGCSSAGSGGQAGSGSAGGGGGGTAVTATETEFRIALSTTTFAPGTYTFTAVNKGTLTHDLVINGPGVDHVKTQGLLAPGQSGSVTVTLKKGAYEIYCGVPGHKDQGMDVHITVS